MLATPCQPYPKFTARKRAKPEPRRRKKRDPSGPIPKSAQIHTKPLVPHPHSRPRARRLHFNGHPRKPERIATAGEIVAKHIRKLVNQTQSPDRTYPCHEIRAKRSRKLLGYGRRSRDREGADSAMTRSSDSAQRTRCSATAGKYYVRVCIWRAVQAVRPEDLAVQMAISPAIAPVLFTYGLLSREAAQDRSPWVERSGTLGANTPQRQPRKGCRSVYTPTLVSLRFSGMVAASPSGSAKDERRLRPANRSRKPQTDECWH